MENFIHLGGATASGGGFLYGSSSSAPPPPQPTVAIAPPTSSWHSCYNDTQNHPHIHNPNPNPNPNQHKAEPGMEAIKARIASHPQYSSLLGAYMECQKVGAPSDVSARLSAAARELEERQLAVGSSSQGAPADPELDQFMEAYCNMLVKYKEELTRPLQEAMDFLKRAESQLNSLTDGASPRIVFPSDDKFDGVGSSEEDQDASGGEPEATEINPRAEDKELKHHLLKKYSGYLSSLRHELSKKKKKGKLPKDARLKLLNWWELHYKWPYPSETEKVALAEATGLDQKQINNWFINQRKRHWKPSEEMQFVVMDGFHPHSAAALYLELEGQFVGNGGYHLGP